MREWKRFTALAAFYEGTSKDIVLVQCRLKHVGFSIKCNSSSEGSMSSFLR